MKKQYFYRGFFYLIGLLSLGVGLVLNTKAELGVAPIITVPYAAAITTGQTLGDMVFLWYIVFVTTQTIIHICVKNRKRIPFDIMQIVLSLVFTRYMNLLTEWIPDFTVEYAGSFMGSIGGQLLVLALAIVFTGIGAGWSMNARLVPNPADGIVQTLADVTRKTPGFMKNVVDISCVCITVMFDIFVFHKPLGIGIGTILAMLLVGRVIAVLNRFTYEPIMRLSGMEEMIDRKKTGK